MILLDTHILLWLAQEPAKLSAKAVKAIRESKDGLAISDSYALASPKSRTFTWPSGAILILAGFRSR